MTKRVPLFSRKPAGIKRDFPPNQHAPQIGKDECPSFVFFRNLGRIFDEDKRCLSYGFLGEERVRIILWMYE